MSRTALAEHLGLSAMAVGRIVRELVEKDLVREAGTLDRQKGPGRRQTGLELIPEGIYAAGIVASAYHQKVAVADGRGEIVAERTVPVDDIRSGPDTVRSLCRALLDLLADLDLPRDRLAGIGGAIAAGVDPGSGRIESADYLRWKPFALSEIVASVTDLPFVGDNIANAINRAETFVGSAQAEGTVALVHAATTLGASFSFDGRPLVGAGWRTGRIGHLPHVETDLVCSCGRSNCLNCSGSGWAILNAVGIATDRSYDPASVEIYAAEIERLVKEDGFTGAESPVSTALAAAGEALGTALWQVGLLYGPQKILLAGALTGAPSYVAGVNRALAAFGPDGKALAAKLVVSSMTPARAATLVALEELVHSPRFEIDAVGAAPAKSRLRSG